MALFGREGDQYVKNDQLKKMKKATTVFIVEDEMLIAACLKDQLQESGFQILGHSARGEKSIEEIHKLKDEDNEPEIVLMDINLRGELDGIETARQITELFNCGIIFLTGQSSKEIYERSFFIKPFGYLLKPYDLEQMVMTIEIASYQRKLEVENREIRQKLETLLAEKTKENTEVLELYNTIVENTLVGVMVFQEDKVVFANNAFANILGCSLEDATRLTTQDLINFLVTEDREWLLGLLEQRLKGETPPQRTLFRIVRADGEIRWVRTYVRRIEFNQKIALHQTYLDVTEYVNFNPEINHQNNEKI